MFKMLEVYDRCTHLKKVFENVNVRKAFCPLTLSRLASSFSQVASTGVPLPWKPAPLSGDSIPEPADAAGGATVWIKVRVYPLDLVAHGSLEEQQSENFGEDVLDD